MRFSIVVPVSFPAPFLDQTLESLTPSILDSQVQELVVVLNGNRRIEIVEAFEEFSASLRPNFKSKARLVHEPEASLLAGRHRGFHETSGDIITFIDSDVLVPRQYVKGLRAAFCVAGVDFATGPSSPMWLTAPPKWMSEITVEQNDGSWLIPDLSLMDFGPTDRVPFPWYWVWGLNYSVRRSKMVEAGGFNPDLAADMRFLGDGEIGLSQKLAAIQSQAGYFPELAVSHIIPASRLTEDYVVSVARRNGISDAYSFARSEGRKSVVSLFVRAFSKLVSMLDLNGNSWGGIRRKKARAHLVGWVSYAWNYLTKPTIREWAARESYLDNFVPETIDR